MSQENNLTESATVRLSGPEYKKLERMAESEHRKLSQLLRILIKEAVTRRGKK